MTQGRYLKLTSIEFPMPLSTQHTHLCIETFFWLLLKTILLFSVFLVMRITNSSLVVLMDMLLRLQIKIHVVAPILIIWIFISCIILLSIRIARGLASEHTIYIKMSRHSSASSKTVQLFAYNSLLSLLCILKYL